MTKQFSNSDKNVLRIDLLKEFAARMARLRPDYEGKYFRLLSKGRIEVNCGPGASLQERRKMGMVLW